MVLKTETLPGGSVASSYYARLEAAGGIPFYHVDVTAGSRLDGVSLDWFTGALPGIAMRAGDYRVTARVRDDDAKGLGQEPEAAHPGLPIN